MDTLKLARCAENTLKTFNLHYMHWAGYPLTVIIGSVFIFFMRLIGINDSIFSVNFMSVVFGSLGIGIFYLFSRKILDRPGALISSLILCFLPLNIAISTLGFTHPISIFFNLAGIYLLFLYFEKYKLNNLILSSIFLGLGTAARLTDGLIIVAVIFLYLAWSVRNSKLSKKLIIGRLVIFLISYSAIILILYLPMFLKIGFSQFKNTLAIYYYYHSFQNLYVSSKWIVDILSIAGIAILIAGIGYFFLEKNRILFYFLLIWFFSLFIYYGSHSCTCYRFLLFSMMPLLIIQGYFISKFHRKPFLFFLIFIFVVINFIEFYPIIQFRHDYNLQEDFAKFVQRNTEPASYIIAMDEGPFIEYYANRKVLYKAIGLNKIHFDKFFEKVDKLLDNGDTIYIISSGIYGYGPKEYFKKRLLNNYNLQYIGWYIIQDWHNKLMNNRFFREKLYRIEKKV
ncbi:MAG: glycosyltransferase family 39 protein [Candidatus Omnitrophica bacterium]|nr:glycosyltransferase family 39 protein [Candidatus Omnitrophota bacterium]